MRAVPWSEAWRRQTLSTEVMPASVHAEASILGAILLDARLYYEAAGRLRVEDFSLDSHRRIFQRMGDLTYAKRAIDLLTLSEMLDRKKEMDSVGGRAYLFSLTEGLPRKISILDYVRTVKDKSLGRQIIGICNRTIARAADQSEDQSIVLGECAIDIENALLDSPDVSDLESIGQYVVSQDPMAQREPGLMTGFTRYDEMSNGLHKVELTIVAARTSVGKTSLAGSLALNLSGAGKPVACFLNEQTKKSFFYRLVSRKSNVPLERIRKGITSFIDQGYIDDAIADIKMLPMYWEASPRMTVPQMRAKCQRLIRGGDELSAILIDQLNHVPADGVVRQGEKLRSDEIIGRIVIAIKEMAQDLNLPVVLFHQVNREGLKNKGSRPGLENLKGSGSCEEHADNVLLLHRPDGEPDDAELIVAKARDGPTGVCAMRFVAGCCSWENRK